MMITMGGKYTTRDGRAVRILCVDGPDPDYPVIGLITRQSVVMTWTSTGRFNNAEDYPCDLIPVPTKHEGWVYLYDVLTGPMPDGGKPKIPVTWES